jgi:hypothetical protein
MWSVLVGAIVLFAFGALWFTVLFGKMWAKLMGFSGDMNANGGMKSMTKPLIINFVLNLIVAWVVYYLFPQLLAVSYTEFLKVILIIWLGFSFPIYVNSALWEKKSWKLVLLNSANGIISAILVSAVVYFMQ